MADNPDVNPELREALERLRYVVPGRNYSDLMIADVETVLNHFGMTNAHGNQPNDTNLVDMEET